MTYKVWSSVALLAGRGTLSSKVSFKYSVTSLKVEVMLRLTSSLGESW